MELTARSEQVLGTTIEVKVPAEAGWFLPDCFTELKRIEAAFSRFLDDSELSKMNSRLGEWQACSAEMAFLLSKAVEINRATDGNFDITLKNALENLGYDREYSFVPKASSGADDSPQSPQDVQVDLEGNRVKLLKQVEFGGFGKGYALDCVSNLLLKNGVEHYYINAGGDIYAKKGAGGDDWVVLLEHPDDRERAIGTLKLDGLSIAASAPNRRKWAGDKHHLLNARTRLPAQGVKAIFVTAKAGLEADAYATAIFTAGFDEGIALFRKLPVEVLMVSSEDKMFKSPGFAGELFS
jgi:thiamine biosynthesis lipoprotein